jgi:hypothetical protein
MKTTKSRRQKRSILIFAWTLCKREKNTFLENLLLRVPSCGFGFQTHTCLIPHLSKIGHGGKGGNLHTL